MYGYGMGGGGATDKLDTVVDFPIESLDMTKHVLGHDASKGPLIYDLYAVSNHYGSLSFGHYTAYAKNGDQWYYYDDSSVKKVDPENAIANSAYNLFYRRRDTPKMEDIDYGQLR
jgi:ubiquitin carboxyl-terminal hydrolase 4/11/15